MATVTERVYADDSYAINEFTGAITRAAAIQANAHYSFTTGSAITPESPDSEISLVIHFPKGTYTKKRMTKARRFAYFTEKSGTMSGSRPSGSNGQYYLDYQQAGFCTEINNQYFDYYTFDKITLNAYSEITNFYFASQDKTYLAVNAGVSGGLYTNTKYTASVQASIQSHLGANKPYIEYTYEDVVPFVTGAYPSSGFINEKVSNTFGWTFAYDKQNVEGVVKQKSAKFRWRPFGSTSYSEILINGDAQQISIPANTFSSEFIEWQVVVTSDDGIESVPTQWYKLTTIDSLSTCSALAPNNAFLDGSVPNEFSWQHIIETGTAQTKFELQYSSNEITWTSIAIQETGLSAYTVPANTLPAGQIQWRVRTYNSDNAAGSWQIATIVVQAAPPAPTISSISNKARPSIIWQALGQQAFQLQVLTNDCLIYDTKEIATAEKQWQVNEYLDNGEYTFRLRVKNQYGLYSEWSIVTKTIAFAIPTIPAIDVTSVEGGVKVAVKNFSLYRRVYLLRNDVPIALLKSNTYIDYLANGASQYIVRGITDNDFFSDSQVVTTFTNVQCAQIAPVDSPTGFILLPFAEEAPPQYVGQTSLSGSAKFFAGRKKPVYEYSEFETLTHDFNFSVSREVYTTLVRLALSGKTVVFRDKRGNKFFGALTGLSLSDSPDIMNVAFSIIEVDYNEKIAYEV